MRTVLVGMAAVLALGAMSAAQTTVPREQPLAIKSMAGADLFKFYCSTCHGEDARGRRAVAPERPAGPDLTILARRNGGVFPRAHGRLRRRWMANREPLRQLGVKGVVTRVDPSLRPQRRRSLGR